MLANARVRSSDLEDPERSGCFNEALDGPAAPDALSRRHATSKSILIPKFLRCVMGRNGGQNEAE